MKENKLPKHIFFDVGHVLVKPILIAVIWQVGPRKIWRYFWKYKKIISRASLQKKLFDYLNYCSQQPTHNSITSCGQEIPQIIYEWITGTKNSTDLLTYIHEQYKTHHEFFDSNIERDLIFATAKLFSVKTHISVQRTIDCMVDLFQECAQKYPGRVHILSNWDLSCNLLKLKYPQIFKTISEHDIIFSCNAGFAKPDSQIFDYAAQKLGLQPQQCILIDDMPANIAGITKWGGHGILHINTCKTKKQLAMIKVH